MHAFASSSHPHGAEAAAPRRHVILLSILIVSLPLGLVVTAPPSAAQTETIIEVAAGRLSRISISDVLNCAVNHVDDTEGELYGDATCDPHRHGRHALRARGHPSRLVRKPAHDLHPDSTPISQSAMAGSGTTSDPFHITTVVDLPARPSGPHRSTATSQGRRATGPT